MKLKITVQLEYPNKPPTEERKYPTSDVRDLYEQTMEIDSPEDANKRLQNIILAFNAFDK